MTHDAEALNATVRYTMWTVFALEEVLPEDDDERAELITAAQAAVAADGLVAVRADSVGTRAPFVQGLVDLVLERAALARAADATGTYPVLDDLAADAADRPVAEATSGGLPPYRSVCRPGCCQMRAATPTGIPAACSTDPWS